MQILRSVDELRSWSRVSRTAPESRVGLVPTMGALHAGHGSLIRAARAACSHVVVSLFVNPTQFGPNEDYARYPRSFDADCALAEREGADVLFAPAVEELYPNGFASTFVEVPGARLRRVFQRTLRQVKAVYPESKFELTPGGMTLRHSRSPVGKRLLPMSHEG